jgi:hypothetical protein
MGVLCILGQGGVERSEEKASITNTSFTNDALAAMRVVL